MRSWQLWLKLEAGGACVCVSGAHALVGATGLFVRGVRFPVGTPLVVQFCRGHEEVSLRGTVSTSYADLGICVEFTEVSGLAVQRLATVLAALR